MIKKCDPCTGKGSDGDLTLFYTLTKLFDKHSFLLGMALAVSFATAFPLLGRSGGLLRPELFIGKYAVFVIFLLSGLAIEMTKLRDALANLKINSLVQVSSFAVWPFFIGLPLVHGLGYYCPNLLPKPLLDGVLILTCLPTTVNMCVILTASSGGNVALALCNAVIGNIIGIFATPALLLRFFDTRIQLPFVAMVLKLCNKVLVPVGTLFVLQYCIFWLDYKYFFS